MDKQTANPSGALLSSWKEIAAYLGVNVRTAQNWEAERGLPVRRIPGGRGRVLASVEELAGWLQAPSAAAVSPVADEPKRAKRWPWVLVFVVMVVVGMWSFLSWPGPPVAWRVVGDALVVVDAGGRELWRKTFGSSLTDYRQFAAAGRNMGWVGDLDEDGEPEVVFLVHSKDPRTPMVYCYSRRGEERWRFVPGQRAAEFAPEFRPPYHPESVIVFRSHGMIRLAVASVHHTWYPSQVALLSGGGRLLREYWHSGHIQRLAVIGGPDRPWLCAGGMANGYRRATLVLLDPEAFGGVSREENPEYQLPGSGARELARVLFPRSCINRARESSNGVLSLLATPEGLNVGVREEGDHPSVVVHAFAPDGQSRGAGLSSGFVDRHTELDHAKLLDHRLDSGRETADLSKIDWLTRPPVFTAAAPAPAQH